MRKLLTIIASLIALLMVILAASYATLHTRYAPNLVNFAFKHILNKPVEVREVNYSYRQPDHFTFEGVLIKSPNTEQSMLLRHVEIWLDNPIWKNGKLQIDNVLLEGMALQNGWPGLNVYPYIHINQLSISSIDFADHGWVARDMSIQIKQPKYHQSKILPFYGQVQISADQIYWQGEALDHVFLDADITPESTTFYDIQFDWRKGKFKAQATKIASSKVWQLPQVSISGLRLQQQNLDEIKPDALGWFTHIPMDIDQLDVNNSSLDTPLFTANNFTVNAQNIKLPFKLWDQQNAAIIASAQSMSIMGEAIASPHLDLNLQPQLAVIKSLSLEALQGDVNLQAQLTPTSLQFNQLNINNIKWIPSADSKALTLQYLKQLDTISAKTLTISNVQVIDLTQEPAMQTSGMSIDGDELELKRAGQWGLWNGRLSISASSTTYDKVTSRNLLLNMHSKDGHFWLENLFVPLEDGLIKGKADMAYAQTSQPWSLNLDASGIPLRFITRGFNLPLHLDGITDLTVNAEGLYGDLLIFNHSVTGKLDATISQATSSDNFETLWLRNQQAEVAPIDKRSQDNPESAKAMSADITKETSIKDEALRKPVIIGDIHLNADRGRVSLKPFSIKGDDFSAHLGGEYDFLFPKKGNVQYRLEGECKALTFNLLGERNGVNVEDSCQSPK
ncbi:AsmA family protein [Vibrio sp. S17_S38]|uniref:AsmA family protein n=1 Tax=Vibrio sp. S17_S38 TaxID=2720229 RepID=UPI001680BFDE|nr:AsmA family protein [Vibrio sp. S17_S38]MBD1574350.1 AsmA family protein [Vibrio sp. S17_S38]